MNRWTLDLLCGAVLLLGLIFSGRVMAGPMAEAVAQNGIRIVLHSEDCKMDGVYEVMKKRATWVTPEGKVTEGCALYIQELSAVMFYWADKTVTFAPAGAFRPLVSS